MLSSTSKTEQLHIAIVGKRNTGKTSLINALTREDFSIADEVPGTTIDPVKKSTEFLPYGQVVLIDTVGIDHVEVPGEKRITQIIKTISYADFAVVVVDACCKMSAEEIDLLQYLEKISVPFLVAVNKIEFGVNTDLLSQIRSLGAVHFEVSCKEKVGLETLKKKLIRSLPVQNEKPIISNLVGQGDVVVLAIPIENNVPKGKLVLPQIQIIRDALDEDTIVVIVKDKEIKSAIANLKLLPDLVVTDSQAVTKVLADIPEEVPLTTFSILMARLKGDLPFYIKGLQRVEELNNGDKVLISEACSNHPQQDDIVSVKIPGWLKKHTGKDLKIVRIQGQDFPENLSEFSLLVHCSGCMITRKQMLVRTNQAKLVDIPVVNYGVLISYMNGAIPRALLPFKEAVYEWERNHHN